MKSLVAALAFALVATAARAEDAAALFAQKCALCHGKDGKGSPVGMKMGVKDLSAVKDSEAALVKNITNGEGKMPAFKGKLTDAQIQALASYVKGGLK